MKYINQVDFFYRFLQVFFKHSLTLLIYYFSAYKLNPSAYGEAIYFISIATLVLMFSDFGVSGSVTKYVAQEKIENSKIGNSVTKIIAIVFSLSIVVLFLIGLVIQFNIISKSSTNHLFLLFPFILFTSLGSVLDGYFVGKKSFRTLFKVNLIYWVVAVWSNYILIEYYGFNGMLLCLSFNSIILFALLLFFFLRKERITKTWVQSEVGEVLKYGVIIGLASLSYFLYTRVDIFVLEHYSYVEERGHYEIINRLFAIIVIPFTILGQVLAPRIAKSNSQGDLTEVLKFFKKIVLVVFLVGVVISLTLLGLVPFVLEEFLEKYNTPSFNSILKILVAVVPLKLVGIIATIGFITPIGAAKITTIVTLVFANSLHLLGNPKYALPTANSSDTS